ncbi:MAG: hypothetical protein CEN92_144 [Candidatus Berkelbacteria bacterium Licking1014_96]|uniref:Uncharacterized protein n=1 Tax=Candidatus Berkelbacteria bacterium Licking1014_96 TaxID=2017149 RepID=A0A554LGU5_9BACT|nr:MAG: hypothetical protein CEN92_144 [Candidatus Berkelbacteria bacterium Licking1014_96]
MTKKITLEKLARMIQKGFKEAKDDVIGVKSELIGVKKELKGDIAAVKSELKGDIKELKADVNELKLTTQRIETRQEAEALRHDRHSILIVDHEKRIKVLEKV